MQTASVQHNYKGSNSDSHFNYITWFGIRFIFTPFANRSMQRLLVKSLVLALLASLESLVEVGVRDNATGSTVAVVAAEVVELDPVVAGPLAGDIP